MSQIQNQYLLTSIFGKWPSFHDAEILSIVLDRSGEDAPSLETKIHLWQMTSEIDSKGYYVLRNHTLVTLRFGHILLESLSGFNQQNVLFNLHIQEINPNQEENDGCCYDVVIESSYGCEALFKCQSITVVAAEPYTPAA